MLMESLVGLSGVPILLDTKDADEIVETVANIAPTFAAIQLEDISAPRCFEIETRLQERLNIPVMHDDQHGTAVVTIAALTNACHHAKIDLKQAVIGQIGLGAAGLATCKMLMSHTGNPVVGADLSHEALSRLEAFGGVDHPGVISAPGSVFEIPNRHRQDAVCRMVCKCMPSNGSNRSTNRMKSAYFA